MHNNNHNIIQNLHERELIAQITNKKQLTKILQSQKITLYCGFDPTSDSLHIGHLIPLLCLRKFQKLGHRPLILLGGATGLIGDPSFKNTERKLNVIETIQEWTEKIQCQISLFIDCSNINNNKKAHILNNYEWFSSMSILPFLRNIGKFFSINKMINKEAIKNRLQRNNLGISYTEFSYNLLQSYDFIHLYKHYGTILQIGGSDQWGNIISGIDLIRRIYKCIVYGFTMPLMTKSDNTKFGKTEKYTIWLDPQKTSPYKFYQYWLNCSDAEVYRFLKFFTNMNIESINTLQQEDHKNNIKPKAQCILASNITKLVHGSEQLKSAQRITNTLFTGKILKLTAQDFLQLAKDGVPTVTLKTGITLQQALIASNLAMSLTQARELIKSHSITINTQKQINTEYKFRYIDRLHKYYTLLKKGKKHYCLIQWK